MALFFKDTSHPLGSKLMTPSAFRWLTLSWMHTYHYIYSTTAHTDGRPDPLHGILHRRLPHKGLDHFRVKGVQEWAQHHLAGEWESLLLPQGGGWVRGQLPRHP